MEVGDRLVVGIGRVGGQLFLGRISGASDSDMICFVLPASILRLLDSAMVGFGLRVR